MDADLRELYQQVIIDHHRRPRHYGALDDGNCHADGYNPLCGDRIHIDVRVDGAQDTVAGIAFSGEGCAICTASASMMTEAVLNSTTKRAEELFERFHELLTTSDSADASSELGKLVIFAGVREFPIRVKCATLPWHTLHAALARKPGMVSTETPDAVEES